MVHQTPVCDAHVAQPATATDSGAPSVPVMPEGTLYPRGFLPMWTEAKEVDQAVYGLAYILQQIQATNSYRPNIGQVNAAMSSLEYAIRALSSGAPPVARERSETVAATGLEADPGCKKDPSNVRP